MSPRPKKSRPKIHQRRLPDYLRDLLIQGEIIGPGLRNGDRIPGSRQLAQKYAVSQITLMRVFQELVEAGILEGGERRRLTVKDIALCRNLTQERGFVTVLVPEIDYFSDFSRGIASSLKTEAPDRQLRLRVQSYQWDDASMLEQVAAMLESRRSVGLVLKIAEAPGWEESLEGLMKAGLPMVLFDSTHAGCDSVVIDQVPGVHGALDHLRDIGCDPIVYLGRFTGRESIERNREHAVRSWFDKNRRPQDPAHFIEFLGEGGYDEWFPKLKRLVGRENKVGVFCHNDKDAVWVHRALAIAGIEVPKRVCLIGYDDKYRITGYDPIPFDIGLSSVDARHGEAGAMAAKLLLKRMDTPSAPYRHEVLPSKLVIRATSEG